MFFQLRLFLFTTILLSAIVLVPGRAISSPTIEQLANAIKSASSFDVFEADVEISSTLNDAQDLNSARYRLQRRGTETSIRYQNGMTIHVQGSKITAVMPDGKKRSLPQVQGMDALADLAKQDPFAQHDLISLKKSSQTLAPFGELYEVVFCKQGDSKKTPVMGVLVAYPEGFVVETRMYAEDGKGLASVTKHSLPLIQGAWVTARKMETTAEMESGGQRQVRKTIVEMKNVKLGEGN